MSTHVIERDGSGTVTVSPRNEGSQSALMVICHGLGDSAEGFADVAEVSSKDSCNALLRSTHFGMMLSVLATSIADASCQVHSTHCTYATRDYEYGHAHAFLV